MDSAVRSSSPLVSRLAQKSSLGSSLLQQVMLGGVSNSNTGASVTTNTTITPPTAVSHPDTMSQLSSTDISDDAKLDLFEDVLTALDGGGTVEPMIPDSVVPLLTQHSPVLTQQTSSLLAQSQIQTLANDTVAPSQSYSAPSSSRVPERSPGMVISSEVPGLATVEYEPSQEIPVEVEGFLERVAEHPESMPQEIVINGNDIALNQQQPPKLAVVVLPISQTDEDLAQGKNPTWSIAWLVEWSHKIIKKFVGKVIYHPVESTQEAAST